MTYMYASPLFRISPILSLCLQIMHLMHITSQSDVYHVIAVCIKIFILRVERDNDKLKDAVLAAKAMQTPEGCKCRIYVVDPYR